MPSCCCRIFLCFAYCSYFSFVHKIGIPRTNSTGKIFGTGSDVTDSLPNSEDAIRRGEYAVIRSLIRVLEVVVFCLSFLLVDFILDGYSIL